MTNAHFYKQVTSFRVKLQKQRSSYIGEGKYTNIILSESGPFSMGTTNTPILTSAKYFKSSVTLEKIEKLKSRKVIVENKK